MIEEGDIEDVASLAELVRLVDVSHARDGSYARVVVEEDDSCGVRQQRFLDDPPVVDLVDLMVPTVIIFLASGRLAELRRRIQDSS